MSVQWVRQINKRILIGSADRPAKFHSSLQFGNRINSQYSLKIRFVLYLLIGDIKVCSAALPSMARLM